MGRGVWRGQARMPVRTDLATVPRDKRSENRGHAVITRKRLFPLLLAGAVLAVVPSGCDRSVQGPDGGDDNGGDGAYSHVRSIGASAHDFLSGASYTALVVEVDYMPGYAPNVQALEQLRTFLEARLNKSAVTIRTPTEVAAGGQQSYTVSEIRSLEEQHRNEYTEDGTLVAYMLIVDGEYEQANVLGIAHLNTSTAYFGPVLDAVSGGLTQPSRRLTESTVFNHEFGHLLGLVAVPGSGTTMQTDHQDQAHGHHCDDDTCLMYWAMENADLFASVLGSEVPALDANCLADLKANGGK